MNWESRFPFEKPREPQKVAIEKGIQARNRKKFFILEAGTGVGKSAIAYTVSSILNDTIIDPDFESGTTF